MKRDCFHLQDKKDKKAKKREKKTRSVTRLAHAFCRIMMDQNSWSLPCVAGLGKRFTCVYIQSDQIRSDRRNTATVTQDKREKMAKKPEKDRACIQHDHDEQELCSPALQVRVRL